MEASELYPDLQIQLLTLKDRLANLEQISPTNGAIFKHYSLEHLSDLMPGILYISDFKNHEVIWANYKSLQMLGYSAEEIKSMGPKYYMAFFHPEDATVFKNIHDFFLQKRGRCFHSSYRLRHRQGSWHWFYSSTIVLEHNEDGIPETMLGVAVDISEQIETNEKLVEILKENQRLKSKLIHTLTKRELEVIKFIAKGDSSKEIAARLHISHYTVETHRRNAMSKLDVHNTASLVRFALDNLMV